MRALRVRLPSRVDHPGAEAGNGGAPHGYVGHAEQNRHRKRSGLAVCRSVGQHATQGFFQILDPVGWRYRHERVGSIEVGERIITC